MQHDPTTARQTLRDLEAREVMCEKSGQPPGAAVATNAGSIPDLR
jgi:hypothetical protein